MTWPHINSRKPVCWINPCPAELLQLYFSSFEAGIANAIPASNDEKYYYLWKIDMSKIKLLDQQSVY